MTSIQRSAPTITDAQSQFLATEIAGTDTDSLAIFLGAFVCTGEGSEAIQKPFIDALDKACNLSR